MRRRDLLTALSLSLALMPLSARAAITPAPFAALEARFGGRLGVAALDLGNGESIRYRASEPFPLCSTFKLSLAALALSRYGGEGLARRIVFSRQDLAAKDGQPSWSPVTEGRVGGDGMSLAELCAAAMQVSDNSAANLLLAELGGPQALTAFWRSLGDPVTRLDRIEPFLNDVPPGDIRDSTTPEAMLHVLRRLLVGNALAADQQGLLLDWMLQSKTGVRRLKAGLPSDWRIGDKTGSGENGVTNDIAILLPPERAPILVCAYYAGSQAAAADREAVLAEVGRIVSR